MVVVPYADEIAIYAPEYHQAHPGCTEAPIGRDVRIRSMSARFMNCSSASTRVVCICISAQRSTLSATARTPKTQHAPAKTGRDQCGPHSGRGGGDILCPQSHCPRRRDQQVCGVTCMRVIMSHEAPMIRTDCARSMLNTQARQQVGRLYA